MVRAGVVMALAVLGGTASDPLSAQELAPEVLDTAYVPGAYRVFTGAGEPATIDDVVAAMGRHEVVFLGETHDDPTAHALEAELLERAWEAWGEPASNEGAGRAIALSLESFERDVQPVLQEYLAGLVPEEALLDAGRPWPRYRTDYRPLVELAREKGLDVIASNAPRRYVNRVSRLGRESLGALGPDALEHLPPLPYGQPSHSYRDQWIGVMGEVMEEEGTRCGVPVADPPAPVGAHADMANLLHGQVLWDATMAWWISRYLEARPEALVLHVVGGFHVARGTGVPEHLEAYRPGTRRMIVMIRPVEDVARFDPAPAGAWGDFVIQTEEARTLEAIECRALQGHPSGSG